MHFQRESERVRRSGPGANMNDLTRAKSAGAGVEDSPEETKGTILLIHPGEILAVEAEGNYVLLRRPTDSYLLRESISTMAEKLQPYGFIRIHRSVLVNASSVDELHPGAIEVVENKLNHRNF